MKTVEAAPPSTPLAEVEPRCPGVTFRVVLLCLALAVFLGYVIPFIDYKFFNIFLGATHLPPGALAALLILVVVINLLLRLVSQRAAFSRNETLTVYLSCLFSALVPGITGASKPGGL